MHVKNSTWTILIIKQALEKVLEVVEKRHSH